MSTTLAQASARVGCGYPALAPWISALGGFLTGSNTAMFAAAKAHAAQAIGYSILTMVAFQNVAASLATMAAVPHVMMVCHIARDTPLPQQTIPGNRAHAEATDVPRLRVWPIMIALDSLILAVLSGLAMGLM